MVLEHAQHGGRVDWEWRSEREAGLGDQQKALGLFLNDMMSLEGLNSEVE